MSVKGPGLDPQFCLFCNLCSKLVNCHHLTTPSYNQRQNFCYGATSGFQWCVLQDLKHLNWSIMEEGQAYLVWPFGKVKCFDTLHPSLEWNVWCCHSIVDKWQTLESAQHCIAQWKSIHHVCERCRVWSPVLSLSKFMFQTCQLPPLTTPSYNDPQYCLIQNLCSKLVNCHHLTTPSYNERSRIWSQVLSLSKFMFKICQLPPSNHPLL